MEQEASWRAEGRWWEGGEQAASRRLLGRRGLTEGRWEEGGEQEASRMRPPALDVWVNAVERAARSWWEGGEQAASCMLPLDCARCSDDGDAWCWVGEQDASRNLAWHWKCGDV